MEIKTRDTSSSWRHAADVSARLTWKDLTVMITLSNGKTQNLLEGISGYAEPGSFTALMGPSGSGKSTLLDALSCRLVSNAFLVGSVLLNGRKANLSFGTAAYVTQDDNLIGTLTVRETISYSAQLRLPDGMPWPEKQALVETTIIELGLQDCADTVIGNWHLRGISGGERKRVSIALEVLMKPTLLFLDEPTSGLDSASAYFVTQTLRGLSRGGRTVIASIHQPSSQMFELFDQLYLLSGGKTVYFGQASEACSFFARAGFPCPDRQNPSDHFLRCINSDFDNVKATLKGLMNVEFGSNDDPLQHVTTAEATQILLDSYRSSQCCFLAKEKIDEMSKVKGAVFSSRGSESSFLMQVSTLTKRSFVNMSRDIGYYWLRLVIYIMVSLCIGIIYMNVGTQYSSIQERQACTGFVFGFLTFMSIGGIPGFIEDMKVFQRERLNGHYGASVFVISNTLSAMPFLLLIAFTSATLIYFMVKLHPGFSHYLYFALCLYATITVVETLLMAIASVVPNFLMGVIIGAGIQGIFLLVAGYFRLPHDIPKLFWRYPLSYMSCLYWAVQGQFQNDLSGLMFDNSSPDLPKLSGEYILVNFFQVNVLRSKWINLSVIFIMIIIFRVFFFLMIKVSEGVTPWIRGYFTRRKLQHKIHALRNKKQKVEIEIGTIVERVPRNKCTSPWNERQDTKSAANVSARLTWKDLTVMITLSNGETQNLLEGISGYAEPGSFTALMGPSGSGKSTLLDALSCRLASNALLVGSILLNGRKANLSLGTVAYVTQDDDLIGTLTVRETISYSAQLRLPDGMPWSEKQALVETTIIELGLQDCADTVIGNWHLRGISGGERKRVSIALEVLMKPTLLFLDEPTSGLDSASAYFVTQTLRRLSRGGPTVIASIHQPSSQMFELFDQLYLLSGGKTVYFGQASEACSFFAVAGFPCPDRQNPSDHFLECINSEFDYVKAALKGSMNVEFASNDDPLEQVTTAEAIQNLLDCYHTSQFCYLANEKIDEMSKVKGTVLSSRGSESSFLMQVCTLTKRSFVNMFRDIGYYWLRFVIYIMVTLCVGSVYMDVGTRYSSIQARQSCTGFVFGFLTFMSIGGFPSFIEDMKVFQRERLNGHYGVGAFVISNTISAMPFLLIIAFTSTTLCYFMVQLHPGFSHYLYFALCLYATITVVESLLMAIASVVPNLLMGVIIGVGIQGIFLMVAGYFRLPLDLPKPFWRYPLSYMSFLYWAVQGQFKNDMSGLMFDNLTPDLPKLSGDYILVHVFQDNVNRSKWTDLGVIFCMIIIYRIFFFLMIKANEDFMPWIRGYITRRRLQNKSTNVSSNHFP